MNNESNAHLTPLTYVLLIDLQTRIDEYVNSDARADEHNVPRDVYRACAYNDLDESIAELDEMMRDDFAANGLHIGNAILATATFVAFAHIA